MRKDTPTRYLSKSLIIIPFMAALILFTACDSGQGIDRPNPKLKTVDLVTVSYTHLRAHETPEHLVCRLLLEKNKITNHKL